MIKRLLFSITLVFCSNFANASNHIEQYNQLKENIKTKYDTSFGIDLSYTTQTTSSNTLFRSFLTPYLNKTISNNHLGKTSFNFSTNIVRFFNSTPKDIASQKNIATLFNNYDTDYNELYELYFAHTFSNKYKWITLGLGQIPISKFDSPIIDSRQTHYFLNSALAQNTTFTYPTSGIGAFTELKLNQDLILNLGTIDATNPLANSVHFKNFDKYSSFISINYTPKIKNKYQGSYSLLIYDKPSVSKAPFSSQGWSLYAAQNISNNHSIFFRLNGATSNFPIINRSYSLGMLYNNPVNRPFNDTLGIAFSTNRINKKATTNTIYNKYEHIIETYYDYKINNRLSIRPDLQLYLNQGFTKNSSPNAIFSLSINLSL